MVPEELWYMLNEIYERDELMIFAFSPQSFLGGRTPFEVLTRDNDEQKAALRSWVHGCLYQTAT